MTEWRRYEARFAKLKGGMESFCNEVAAELKSEGIESAVFEDNGDDYGFMLDCRLPGTDQWQAGFTFHLEDSAEYEGTEPGEAGNLHITGTKDGGLILFSFAPYNHTPECWLSYTAPDEEWAERLALVTSEPGEVAYQLEKACREVDS